MKQKLILPINSAKLTASWKTTAYTAKIGYVHYGADMVSRLYNRTVYAMGSGVVVARGTDSVVGLVIAVRYPEAVNHVTGQVKDLVVRHFHMASINVTVGQKVTKDTVLGQYGSTGMLSMSPHLHLEMDTDTLRPLYSPTVYSSSLLQGRMKGATDRTMTSPMEWLYCKTSAPDLQSYTTTGDQFIRAEERTLPSLR